MTPKQYVVYTMVYVLQSGLPWRVPPTESLRCLTGRDLVRQKVYWTACFRRFCHSDIFFILFSISFAMAVLGVCGLPFWLREFPAPPPYYDPEDVLDSLEYQIALNPKPSWTDRDGMMRQWIESMNRYNRFINFTWEGAKQEVYYQYHIKPGRCGGEDFRARVRHFLDSGKSVISLKSNNGWSDIVQCTTKPFWPAEKYYASSRQKCERDYHPCFDKFTRGSTVVFDEPNKEFARCDVLADIFPNAFPGMTPARAKKEANKKPGAYWWRMKWSGIAGDHLHYDVTFTIKYRPSHTPEMIAKGGIPIINGEWSLRTLVFPGQTWEREVMEDLRAMFYKLVIEHDTYKDHVQCAHSYLNGEPIRLIDGPGRPMLYDDMV